MQGINPYAKLSRQIGYEFKDTGLLKQALTHRSAAKQHNERLEFLGDAVLGMIIARELYDKFPQVPEGKLTRMRSTLVKGDTLAELARESDVGELMNLGPGELKSGGHRRSSIIADAMEAIIGAIYLEAGLEQTEQVVLHLWKSRINKLDPNEHPKDAKTRLQEFLQSRKLPLPVYEVVKITGKDHAQTFVVHCQVANLNSPLEGVGSSRRKAEQQAANLALETLMND
ncbi:MAG: ribonuclease III [Pseudomonadota bacterium]|jgi:ribonuclease-3|uniref:Ribonuclease 3 n=1 Tax=Marisediminitalea aggregata TaxID=634436 RepID=A0A1M5L5Y0_9ALTE|nr:ribonuclease III [Marisediminitalea aggregata]MAP21708.1 ribonuclease III [Alteromonadaceae bacterium]MCP3862696.1 ribonuclease III [Aestuariibacter sp.]MEC8229298.1 ribonuclease III [Pseudomonadota bacterium]BBO26895.1 ribonuclease 3 [Alteromonas sp. I4]HBY41209.1 ribonuclease III [Alteromonas sp.]|tara:strand:+ start:11056 stop:11739 length:684 start_codon:yes stop_codon:yes gene_type:complete